MKKYNVAKNIDYITATFSHPHALPKIESDNPTLELSAPSRNYNRTITYQSGVRVMYHSENTSVLAHAIYGGEALGVLRGDGHTDESVLASILASGGRIGRVDIAVTSEARDGSAHELLPHDIAVMCKNGELQSRLKPDNHVANPEIRIETAYIGSRKARNRLFRAYDKGLEMDLDRHKIVRYEMETRKNAIGIVNAIMLGTDIGAIIRRYVDFPQCETWVAIMDAHPATLHHTPQNRTRDEIVAQKRADRWHWLVTTAARTLARALLEDGIDPLENKNLDLFASAINAHMKDIDKRRKQKLDIDS